MQEFDVCIIGSGAAGLTAAIYAARKNLGVIVLDKGSAGGQTANAIFVENYPGFEKIRGKELMDKMLSHARSFGVQVKEAVEVQEIKRAGAGFEITIDAMALAAKAVILATGTTHRRLNVPGEKELYGKGVSYCATCDGPFFRKQRVAVIGAGNSGVTAALLFNEISSEIFLIEFMPECKCDEIYKAALEKTKVRLMTNTMAVEILGKSKVEGIKIKNRGTGKEETIPLEGVFIYAGLLPENDLAKKLGAKIDDKGFIAVDNNLQTSVEGLFDAGDITGNFAQTVWAAAEGAKAATSAYNFIKKIA